MIVFLISNDEKQRMDCTNLGALLKSKTVYDEGQED